LFKWAKRFNPANDAWAEEFSRRPEESPRQIAHDLEEAILGARRQLVRDYRFSGPQAILWELEDQRGQDDLPSLSTIKRVLLRHHGERGLVPPGRQGDPEARYRPRGKAYPAPPSGRANLLHQGDFVGPCYLSGGARFYSLHVVDVATRRAAVEPLETRHDEVLVEAVWRIWSRLGIPRCFQLDNELCFLGSHRYPRGTGQLIRLCLRERVEPVFIPAGEPWRNSLVEKFNEQFEDKFLAAVYIRNLRHLKEAAMGFEHKHNRFFRYAALSGKTPNEAFASEHGRHARLRLPETPTLVGQMPLPRAQRGTYRLIRFIRSDRLLDVFGERFLLPQRAVYEYVTASIDVKEQVLSVLLGGTDQVASIPYPPDVRYGGRRSLHSPYGLVRLPPQASENRSKMSLRCLGL